MAARRSPPKPKPEAVVGPTFPVGEEATIDLMFEEIDRGEWRGSFVHRHAKREGVTVYTAKLWAHKAFDRAYASIGNRREVRHVLYMSFLRNSELARAKNDIAGSTKALEAAMRVQGLDNKTDVTLDPRWPKIKAAMARVLDDKAKEQLTRLFRSGLGDEEGLPSLPAPRTENTEREIAHGEDGGRQEANGGSRDRDVGGSPPDRDARVSDPGDGPVVLPGDP
jgi:hypothetical protein